MLDIDRLPDVYFGEAAEDDDDLDLLEVGGEDDDELEASPETAELLGFDPADLEDEED